MKQFIANIQYVVRDYDEAIEFFTKKLHFTLVEDIFLPEEKKRWVTVAPFGSTETRIILGKAKNPEQEKAIGHQTGGRVFLVLATDDFWRDYNEMIDLGIKFVRPPREDPYGTVAVWEDLYGNWWDLVELKK